MHIQRIILCLFSLLILFVTPADSLAGGSADDDCEIVIFEVEVEGGMLCGEWWESPPPSYRNPTAFPTEECRNCLCVTSAATHAAYQEICELYGGSYTTIGAPQQQQQCRPTWGRPLQESDVNGDCTASAICVSPAPVCVSDGS